MQEPRTLDPRTVPEPGVCHKPKSFWGLREQGVGVGSRIDETCGKESSIIVFQQGILLLTKCNLSRLNTLPFHFSSSFSLSIFILPARIFFSFPFYLPLIISHT